MKRKKTSFDDRRQMSMDFGPETRKIQQQDQHVRSIVSSLNVRRDQKRQKTGESALKRLLQFARQLP